VDTNVFNAYSQYYDLLYKDKNYFDETEYVNALIQEYCTETTHILELGCGTGIHAIELAKRGYTIHGIDISETMLKLAIEKQLQCDPEVSEKLSFQKSDIKTFESHQKFETIISLFHVISYMTTNEDLNQTFKTVKDHLKPNGVFIFDCWHGPGVLSDPPSERTKKFENEIVSIQRNSKPNHISENNTVDVNFDIFIKNKQSNESIVLHELHSMRYLFLDEVTTIANSNGLALTHAEEWLTKKALSQNSWNACYVCKLKK